MDHGPWHVQEFAGWIESLLRAMTARYGEERASGFWFRVGTEPNTRPGHWNDSNAKYVEEYVAVSQTVAKVLPKAKVGLANMGADGSSWETRVMPMAKGIADAKARVDFIAMSCYGRGTLRRYSIGTAALCSERLQRMRKLGVKRKSTAVSWMCGPTDLGNDRAGRASVGRSSRRNRWSTACSRTLWVWWTRTLASSARRGCSRRA